MNNANMNNPCIHIPIIRIRIRIRIIHIRN